MAEHQVILDMENPRADGQEDEAVPGDAMLHDNRQPGEMFRIGMADHGEMAQPGDRLDHRPRGRANQVPARLLNEDIEDWDLIPRRPEPQAVLRYFNQPGVVLDPQELLRREEIRQQEALDERNRRIAKKRAIRVESFLLLVAILVVTFSPIAELAIHYCEPLLRDSILGGIIVTFFALILFSTIHSILHFAFIQLERKKRF